ncbi:MAG: hypothetical protein R3247_15240, partial [Rhodothermales bacterium]|nr:hypothetical protein [Rhodothermales bacterium]
MGADGAAAFAAVLAGSLAAPNASGATNATGEAEIHPARAEDGAHLLPSEAEASGQEAAFAALEGVVPPAAPDEAPLPAVPVGSGEETSASGATTPGVVQIHEQRA